MQSAARVVTLELADGETSHVVLSPGAALRDQIQSCRQRFAGVHQFIPFLGQNGVLVLRIRVALPVPVALLVAAGLR